MKNKSMVMIGEFMYFRFAALNGKKKVTTECMMYFENSPIQWSLLIVIGTHHYQLSDL